MKSYISASLDLRLIALIALAIGILLINYRQAKHSFDSINNEFVEKIEIHCLESDDRDVCMGALTIRLSECTIKSPTVGGKGTPIYSRRKINECLGLN